GSTKRRLPEPANRCLTRARSRSQVPLWQSNRRETRAAHRTAPGSRRERRAGSLTRGARPLPHGEKENKTAQSHGQIHTAGKPDGFLLSEDSQHCKRSHEGGSRRSQSIDEIECGNRLAHVANAAYLVFHQER